MQFDDETPYISKEQQEDFDLLENLSDAISEEIRQKRDEAISVLIQEDMLVAKKKEILKRYVSSRIDFNNQKISWNRKEYHYSDVCKIAEKLYDDNTFFGSDSPCVLDGMAFYDNSISFEDVILAFHNFRLEHNEENFWWLSLLLSRFIYWNLSMDSNYTDISYEKEDSCQEIVKLAEYVIEFWNKYLKNEQLKSFDLVDDQKREFSDKIDYDAGYFFASEDAENDDERKRIDSEHASELVSHCSKSIYLLLTTIKEIDDIELAVVKKNLRSAVVDICDKLYYDDAYGELEKDNRINSDALREQELTFENNLLKYTLKSIQEKINQYDTETALINRKEMLQDIKMICSDDLIEDFVREYSESLMKKIEPCSMECHYERLKKELGVKYDLLPEDAVNALASAEYLYDMFVRKKAPEGFDYSGIAVLYFQTFETAYDRLLIAPYSKWLTDNNVNSFYEKKKELKKKLKSNITTKSEKDQIRKSMNTIEKDLDPYFSMGFDKDLFYNKEFVTSLEIGKFQKFIDFGSCITKKNNDNAKQLIYYLETECFKKPIDAEKITDFAKAVGNATSPRNRAAHGLHGLNEEEAVQDKIIVYDESNLKDILNFKNLLYAFLDFFER